MYIEFVISKLLWYTIDVIQLYCEYYKSIDYFSLKNL